jgi:NAD(P)-dependent dehydrogenase (short-subunit alcohol dehydrogenase family)
MQINVTATWRLIRSLDPLLQFSDAGRAILMSSGAASSCKPFWGPYSASKAAVEALGRTWAAETRNGHLRVNMVDPGATRTAMRAQAVPGEDPSGLPHPSDVAEALMPLVATDLIDTGRLFEFRSGRFLDFQKPS